MALRQLARVLIIAMVCTRAVAHLSWPENPELLDGIDELKKIDRLDDVGVFTQVVGALVPVRLERLMILKTPDCLGAE